MPLIESPRQTAADLAHWRSMERLDRVLAQSSELSRMEQRALAVLREFARKGPSYVGVSWGKDSVVVAHLAWRLRAEGVHLPLVWVRVEPIENPDCVLVRDAFLARFPLVYHEVVAHCWHDETGRLRAKGTLEQGFARARDVVGARHVSGIRGQESSERALRMAHFGEATDSTCAPIGWWRGEHVFAYLAKYDLPIHPAYAMTWGGTLDRARVRVSALGLTRGTGRGRTTWERQYYRDVLEDIERRGGAPGL